MDSLGYCSLRWVPHLAHVADVEECCVFSATCGFLDDSEAFVLDGHGVAGEGFHEASLEFLDVEVVEFGFF